MNVIPMPDLGWATAVLIFGARALLYAIPFTILVETFIIQMFLNLRFWRSLGDAIIMNVASGVLGFLALGYEASWFIGSHFWGAYEATQESVKYALLIMLGIQCLISIVVEGMILRSRERDSSQLATWFASLTGNLGSYLGLFIIILDRFITQMRGWIGPPPI